jgi:hypothetical protein
MKANINRIFSTSVLIFLLFFSVIGLSDADRPDEYVPYEGAVDDVDLGVFNLDAERVTAHQFVSHPIAISGAANAIALIGSEDKLNFISASGFAFQPSGGTVMDIIESLVTINGRLVVDDTSEDAFVVRKDNDGLEVFKVGTDENEVRIAGALLMDGFFSNEGSLYVKHASRFADDLTIEGELLGSRQNFQFGHKRVARGRTYLYMEGNDIQCSEELGVPMIRDGSIVGASVVAQINNIHLPGTFEIHVKINDETVYTLSEEVDSEGYLVNHGTQERGLSEFSAGDLIQVEVLGLGTSDIGRYRYSNVQSMVEVQFDN